jgi:hypothetical protein
VSIFQRWYLSLFSFSFFLFIFIFIFPFLLPSIAEFNQIIFNSNDTNSWIGELKQQVIVITR